MKRFFSMKWHEVFLSYNKHICRNKADTLKATEAKRKRGPGTREKVRLKKN
jgi:hypothetical protein